jgi:hypothetical protein
MVFYVAMVWALIWPMGVLGKWALLGFPRPLIWRLLIGAVAGFAGAVVLTFLAQFVQAYAERRAARLPAAIS